LDILATSVAYVIAADGKTTVEEKAKLITMLGKHVANNDLTQADLQTLTQSAFTNTQKIPVEKFLSVVTGSLSAGQKAVLLLNLYDVAAVDGSISMGEREVVEAFEKALKIDEDTMKTARNIIAYKNDTRGQEGCPIQIGQGAISQQGKNTKKGGSN
jgi:uncharacterized tellurite resistance protein B-like protein